MSMTRRTAIKLLAGAFPAMKAALSCAADETVPEIQPGPFQGAWESLKAYQIPDWYRDAKFGIWAHWGPESAPEFGDDWYARHMYIQDKPAYKYHVQKYGHPSKFGFKDVIRTWKGDKFDPDYLVSLYKKAGAKFFVSMGVHHDNFDLWNSKHTRWNSVNMGPKKDIVGLFRQAALKHGLRFGVSDHLWISYKWWGVSHLSDKEGPLAGVPYDGTDPKYADLYHDIKNPSENCDWNEVGLPPAWQKHWFLRIKDLVDQYQPDLLYCDGHLPFGELGLNLVAHFYNQNANLHGGAIEAVYTSKRKEDSDLGACVRDVERGVPNEILPNAWQTDTCVGNWHYGKNANYKSPKTVIDMLVDIVSQNGNMLLNFPLSSSGILDDKELKIISEITDWMAVNNEAIYATRPWKIFGEGPNTVKKSGGEAKWNEGQRRVLTADDVRFTTKGPTLYAFFMGWPEKEACVEPLATNGKHVNGQIQNVELLGSGKVQWTQDQKGLKVQLPAEKPCNHACALKVEGLDLS